MSRKKNPNQESPDIADYLNLSKGRYYEKSSIDPINNNLPSRRCFPTLKYGISGDAPNEFHTKNATINLLLTNSILHKDPAMKSKSKDSPSKNPFDGYPIKSIQTYDISNTLIPIKQETRSAKPKSLYKCKFLFIVVICISCIVHEKRMVQRPDLITREETLYTQKFYEELKDNKPFHRKPGYSLL